MTVAYPFGLSGIECPEYKELPNYERAGHTVLSVIVTTYNRAPILKLSLDSIILQDFPLEMYEVIIVDDASEIGDQDVIKEYVETHPDHNIRVILLNESKTFNEHGTVNIGIKKARGEIYVRHQADLFYLHNDYLSGLYRHHLVRDDLWVNGVAYGPKRSSSVDDNLLLSLNETVKNKALNKIIDIGITRVFPENVPLEMGSSLRNKWAHMICGYNEDIIGNIPGDVPFMCNLSLKGVKFCVDPSLRVMHLPYAYKRPVEYNEDQCKAKHPSDPNVWHQTTHPWGA